MFRGPPFFLLFAALALLLPSRPAHAQYYVYTAPKDRAPFLNTRDFPCNTTVTEGSIRFNTSSNAFEGCNGSSWSSLGSGGGSGPIGSTTQIAFNSGGTESGDANFTWNTSTAKLTVTGDISYSGIITDTSDERLKRDIRPLSERGDMLDKLARVDTYSYIRRNNPDNRVEYGVVAQQLKTVFPDLVHTADDSTHTESVDYTGLIPPLIESVKELKAQNDSLKAQLAATESRLDSLKADMKGMEIYTGYGVRKAGFGIGALAAFGLCSLIFLIGGILRNRQRKPAE